MQKTYKFEIEIFPGCWEEIDPENLYDNNQKTLASYEDIDPEKLEGTLWWLSDFTQAPKRIRIIEDK
ncbi:MAG: hypothetical protein JW786_10965 [Desulfobacterales bacterium]|nr:hypothetical protein [Desulfobacterales bacterium]